MGRSAQGGGAQREPGSRCLRVGPCTHHCAHERNGGCMVRPEDNGYPAHVGRRLLEHSYPFATHLRLKVREPGYVPAWACKAGDKCTTAWIGDLREYDRDHVGQAVK